MRRTQPIHKRTHKRHWKICDVPKILSPYSAAALFSTVARHRAAAAHRGGRPHTRTPPRWSGSGWIKVARKYWIRTYHIFGYVFILCGVCRHLRTHEHTKNYDDTNTTYTAIKKILCVRRSRTPVYTLERRGEFGECVWPDVTVDKRECAELCADAVCADNGCALERYTFQTAFNIKSKTS